MNTNTVDAKILGRMFLSGAKNLEAKKEWINELNVFPVPDRCHTDDRRGNVPSLDS